MPITDLAVSLDQTEETKLRKEGFTKLDVNLNDGNGGNKIYIWYKEEDAEIITRIQFSYDEATAVGLSKAGYKKIDQNLNAGAGAAHIYLWFYKGDTDADFPILKLDVTTEAKDEAENVKSGWERLNCNLNKDAGGNWIYLWLQRKPEVHIGKITATSTTEADADLFKKGYTRVDDNTNKPVDEGRVFLWYLLTAEKQAIEDLQVSHDPDEYNQFKGEGYTLVNKDLNKGTGGNRVFLWYKREGPGAIRSIGIITDRVAKPYENVGAIVIKLNKAKEQTHLYFKR